MKRLFLFLPLLLVGCSDSPQVVQQALMTPEFVGKTEDGLLVKRYHFAIAGTRHYIYVLHTNPTVSVNHREGKSDQVDVIVNGRRFIEKE